MSFTIVRPRRRTLSNVLSKPPLAPRANLGATPGKARPILHLRPAAN